MKLVLHSDINNFFASVECLMNPELASKPVAVAGNIEKRSGIILAKNQKAKAKGVQTGEAIWQAKQKCPDLVTVLPNYSAYRHYSRLIISIYQQYTDKIEGMGLDECWLDMTQSIHLFVKDLPNKLSLMEKGVIFAELLQTEIQDRTGLGVSVGVSFSKLFAKLASDMKKPKGITLISPENFKEKVYPCAVRDVLGVGRQTEKALAKMNIFTLGDLAHVQKSILKKKFGIVGLQLQEKLLGSESENIGILSQLPPPKSVGNGTTLVKDSTDKQDISSVISMLCSQIAMRLREQYLACSCISVSIKTNEFEVFSHEKKLAFMSNDEVELAAHAVIVLEEFWFYKTPIRSIRICTSKLTSTSECIQLSLFQKNANFNLGNAIDKIRNKYGYHKLETAKSQITPKVSQSFD